MASVLLKLYDRYVLGQPKFVIAFTFLITAFAGYYSTNFKLDASADSLVLENDQALEFYRAVKARYGSDDFLIITYSPDQELFSEPVLADLHKLRDATAKLARIESVVSLFDVPLIQSPPVTLSELSEQVRTLDTPGMDIQMARREFLSSPLYKNLLISEDGKTTALQLNFKRDKTYYRLLKQRNQLRTKKLESQLSDEEKQSLDRITREFKDYSYTLQDQDSKLIETVRELMDQHRANATLFLGGVPMIAADSITFIQRDLNKFGVGVVLFIILILAIAFHKPRWIILPMVTCLLAGIIMVGYLGYVEWRVTVVSSNFISLLLIITLSLSIHLIVRYRELHHLKPERTQFSLVEETIRSKFLPSFYTAITTMVAFGSLIVSGIRPVIDFGWMMVIGIAIAFILTFTFFPAVLLLLKPGKPTEMRDITAAITGMLANIVHHYRITTLLVFALFIVGSAIGISSLTVENRFIDYYKDTTEIYQGMELIDKQLGGTTPMDVIIDAPGSFFISEPDEYDFDDELAAELELELADDEAGITATSYWFNTYMLEQVKEIHQYLDSLSETGKILSIHTTLALLEQLNEKDEMDDFFLSILYKRIPDDIRESLISPYLSKDGNQIRFSIRVYESDKNLQREQLIQKIHRHLKDNIGLEDSQVHTTGMVVLYNNMLQSLFKSQILTIGVVFLAILIMFAILFQSIHMAIIAIIPNMIAAGMVLGLMGLTGVPLDIMTITIAAICIGIAVDDTIHYVHRYKEEFPHDRDYWQAIQRCHASIGRAMYYTSVTITLGFSILALSNFIPMIYFGLLTGFAMVVALLANMTLLPLLIAYFKPLNNYKLKTA